MTTKLAIRAVALLPVLLRSKPPATPGAEASARLMRLQLEKATKGSQKTRMAGVAGGLGRLEVSLNLTYVRTAYGRH